MMSCDIVFTSDRHVNDFLTNISKHFTNGKVLNVGRDTESQSVFITSGIKEVISGQH